MRSTLQVRLRNALKGIQTTIHIFNQLKIHYKAAFKQTISKKASFCINSRDKLLFLLHKWLSSFRFSSFYFRPFLFAWTRLNTSLYNTWIRVKKSPAKKFPAIKSPKVTWCAIKFPAKKFRNLSMSLLLFRNKGILRYLLAY